MKYTFGSPKMHDLNHVIVENLITIKFNYHAINQIFNFKWNKLESYIYEKKKSCQYLFTTCEYKSLPIYCRINISQN